MGIDNVALSDVDIVYDLLNFPYPIENESFDIIYLRHVIEHFQNQDYEKIINECSRILVQGGLLRVTVPHAFSIAAFTDPTHKSFFLLGSGYYWDREYQKSYYKRIKLSWKIIDIKCSRITWFDWKGYNFKTFR